MKTIRSFLAIDHYLLARVQARCSGQEAHDVHALIATYYGMCELADEDPSCRERAEQIEARLREVCRARELRVATADWVGRRVA